MNFTRRNNKKSSKGAGIAGLLFGIVMFLGLTVVLFNNEGVSVKRAKALKNIADAVEVMSTSVMNENEGALILFSGMPETNDVLKDDQFEVMTPESTLRLSRSVQMYQWHEDSDTEDDETTYSYFLDWSDDLIDSTNFEFTQGHQNPTVLPYKEFDLVADDVSLDAFNLDAVFVKKLNNFEPLILIQVTNDPLLVTSIEGDSIFQSAEGFSSFQYPELGDVLISYEIVSPETITLVGKQEGKKLTSFETKTGMLAEVSTGVKNKLEVMEEKLTQNKIKTFAIRIGSLIGLMIAVGLIFSPITNLLSKIPLVGNLVNRGIGLIGAILGGAWGVLVIAAGWLFFKPFLGIGLIVLAVGTVVFFAMRSKDKSLKAEPAI